MLSPDAGVAERHDTQGRERGLVFLVMALYVACFHWMYVHFLYPSFEYLGYNYDPPASGYFALSIVLSLSPCLWMPLKLTRPSQLAYWVLYVTVLIPSMFVPLYAGYESTREVAVMMAMFFLAFLLTGLGYLLPLWKLDRTRLRPRTFWRMFGFITIGLTAWLVIVFRHNLQFVSFNDIYDLRFAANDLADGTLVNYAFMPLTGAINPLLMGYGLFYRRRWIFLLGVAGQLLVYSVLGTKGSVLSILFVPGIYFLLKIKRFSFGLNLALASLALIATACLLLSRLDPEPGTISGIVLFVVFARTLSMGGLLTAQYFDFFLRNPYTYWSHLKVVDWFIHYPYQYGVGQEVGVAYGGTTALNATTHFYATDGIGAAGLAGLVVMGLVSAAVFWMLDSAAQHRDPRLAVLITSYAAFNLANISMFTSLLSGGLGMLMLCLYLLPPMAPNSAGQFRIHGQTAPGVNGSLRLGDIPT